MKWIVKYNLLRKPYDPKTVGWVVDAIDNGIGYWDVKKVLLIKGIDTSTMNEILWIYDKILKQKGGIAKDGQRIAGSSSKAELSEKLPDTKSREEA